MMYPGDGTRPLAPPLDVSATDPHEPTNAGVTVEVGVRSLSDEVRPLLDETLELLETARRRGVVEELRVAVWGRCFDPTAPAATTPAGRRLAEQVDAFREWAAANGVTFGPYFRTERLVDHFTDTTPTRIRVPTVTHAEYRGRTLGFVAPCSTGGRYYGVLDRAATLAAGPNGRTGAADRSAPVEPTGGDGASIRT